MPNKTEVEIPEAIMSNIAEQAKHSATLHSIPGDYMRWKSAMLEALMAFYLKIKSLPIIQDKPQEASDQFNEGYKKAVATVNPEIISRQEEIDRLSAEVVALKNDGQEAGLREHAIAFALSKLDNYEYMREDVEEAYDQWLSTAPAQPPSPPLPFIDRVQEGERGEAPKMSDKLAAEADIAAIDFSRLVVSPDDDTHYGSELTDAYEAGQSWMWRKLQVEISSLKEANGQLRESLDDSRAEIELLRKSGGSLRDDKAELYTYKNACDRLEFTIKVLEREVELAKERAQIFLEQNVKLTEDMYRLSHREPAPSDYFPSGEKAGPAGRVLLKELDSLYNGFNIKMLGEHESRIRWLIDGLRKGLVKVDDQWEAKLEARAIAFAIYSHANMHRSYSSGAEVYRQFLIDEAEKIKNHEV